MSDTSCNPLTLWLAEECSAVSPASFYRELFPSGSLSRRNGDDGYNAILLRVLSGGAGRRDTVERHLVYDDLEELEVALSLGCLSGTTTLVSPVSYAGRRPMLSRAHELFAMVIDLDGLKFVGGEPHGIENLFYQFTDRRGLGPLHPTPTFVVSSGSGLHLYYLFDEPVRMWPNVIEALATFRKAFTKKLWHPDVTTLSQEVQYESVVQSFRAVGTASKDGSQTVTAFRTGGRMSVEELNRFVPQGARIDPGLLRARHTREEARALWPDWDPDWRGKALAAVDRPWHVKRDLYDWFVRRVEDGAANGEVFEGNRYWCVFMAACYAAKCPDVTYEELESWAYGIRPGLDAMTKREGNDFTEQDVALALAAYGNPLSVKIRRDKVSEKTCMPMRVNKRNYRKQADHLARARFSRDFDHPDGTWCEGNSRKGIPNKSHPKRDAVLSYATDHPDATQRQIAEALGISKTTVNKWLRDAR